MSAFVKLQRDRVITHAARLMESVLPAYYGSVRINFTNGRAMNGNLEESVKFSNGKPERQESTDGH